MGKKTICLSIILAVLLLSMGVVFADDFYEIDPFTGAVIGSSEGTAELVRVSSACNYNRSSEMYVYTTSASPNTDVTCSIYNGEITTERVELEAAEGASIAVYQDGAELVQSTIYSFSEAGAYVVRDRNTDKEIFSFRIVNEMTGAVNSYAVPEVFFVSGVKFDGISQDVPPTNTIPLTEEGEYEITYRGRTTDVRRKLNVVIDHTAPELEIFGVENGIASGPVTFGDTEYGSDLEIYLNGEVYETLAGVLTGPLKKAGNYHIVYTDKAGNAATYDFTMRVFFDLSAWFAIVVFALLIAAIAFFMIRSRKHMRTY